MGPLVPDIIGNELNYIVAFLIGIGFGLILEQAGFSTSKKLVGLFYGYDFTVLRVFFTAGLTAMVGVIIFDSFHLLNMKVVFINPLFLWSAIVGGLIMGLGFVIGGFCPGTSICAASIGKIDGMFFVLGSMLGIFAFAEGYPLFEKLYKAAYYGTPQMSDTLHIPNGIFAFLFILMAIVSFYIALQVEKRINKTEQVCTTPRKVLISLAGVSLLIGLIEIFVPTHAMHIKKINEITDFSNYQFNIITPDELALRILEKDNSLQFIDLRSEKEFKKFALPDALNGNYEDFINRFWEKVFNTKGKINVVYADDENTEKKAALVASDLGYPNVYILEGGLKKFVDQILNFKNESPANSNLSDVYKFRAYAAKKLPAIFEESKPKVIQAGKVKRVLGGC